MEGFLEHLFIVLPAVGVDIFIQRVRPVSKPGDSPESKDSLSVQFALVAKKHGLQATAILKDGEFIVEAGSLARNEWKGQGSNHTSYAQFHQELRRSGILKQEDENCIFVENYAFKSPSAAAAVVLGRSANGTVEWRHQPSGMTYKEWEAKQLESTDIET